MGIEAELTNKEKLNKYGVSPLNLIDMERGLVGRTVMGYENSELSDISDSELQARAALRHKILNVMVKSPKNSIIQKS